MLDIVMAAAGNLFDLEIDLKKIAGGAQDSESGGQNFRPDPITGQCCDVIGLLWRHRFCSRKIDYK